MSNADYYTSDPECAATHHQPGFPGYDQAVPQSNPSSPFGFQEQIPASSYSNSPADPAFITPSFTSYAQPNFLGPVDSQQSMPPWPQQDTGSIPTALPDSTAMDPSHLSFFAGDGDSVFSRYLPMDSDAMYLNRCSSPCAESCKSQCGDDGDADICHDPNCEDVSDFCTDTDCVDQVACSLNTCPITGLSSGDEDAAATLASIHGGSSDPSTSPRADGELSTQTQSSLRLAPSTSPQSSLMTSPPMSAQYTGTFPNYFPYQPMAMGFYSPLTGDFSMNLDLVDDLITHHNPQQSSHSHSTPHFRPCPLDNAQLLTRRCMLPRSAYHDPTAQSLDQMADANNYNLSPDACGVYLSGPDEVLPHIANSHPRAFTTLQSYLETSTTTSGMSEANKAALLSAIGAAGPVNSTDHGSALFDSYSTTPSSTPHDSATPLTQGSDITLDTVESASQFVCKWREDSGRPCGQHFDDSEGLHQHVVTHSRSLKKAGAGHRCRWAGCTRAEGPKGCFPQRTKLERHLQTHTGFKPAECSICGLALSGAQALSQHMRTHTNETPWKCTFEGCGKMFKQQSALTMHTRTHTDEKPLSCDICGKRFSESSNLSKHKKIHSRSFRCPVCGKDFSRADQLRKHERLHEEAAGGGLAKTQGGRVAKVKG